MATVVMSNPNKPTTMRLRMTYEVYGGTFALTKLEGCRTDNYGTHSTWSTNRIKVTVNGSTASLIPIDNNIDFPANSAYRTMWSGYQTWSCIGNVGISIGFTSTTANINNASFSTTVYVPDPATAPTGCYCSVTGKTETSVTLNGGYSGNGGASITGCGFQYSTDANNWYNCDANIYGLNPNTNYYFRYYASNSVGTSYSGNANTTTYPYPYFTSVPEFIVGNELTISIYNPLGRECSIYVIGNDGKSNFAGNITNGSISPFNSAGWCDWWYSTLPELKSGKYRARLVCNVGNVDSYSNYVNYYFNPNDTGFKPVFNDDYVIEVKNTLESIANNISGSTKFIKGYNKLSGVIKPMSLQRHANGGYYNISASGLQTVQKQYFTYNQSFDLGNMITSSFNVTAVDGRGFETGVTKNIDFIDYNLPSVTKAKIVRQYGISEKAKIDFSGIYTSWEGKGLLKENTITSIKYKIGNSGNWKSLPSDAEIIMSGKNWSVKTALDDTFAVASQYDLYLQVSDLLDTIELGPYIISTADAYIWKDLANKRIGINKKPNHTLDIGGDLNTNALYINGTKVIWYE